ncbi:hypothetical protein HN954_01755 [bacterium]|nr:hypothetical protein [bacterium]MBT6832190.1 hypothetical protein [bacterium]MBT6996135.1 hypothetical protein [bacterium]MBT7772215.1 hypothetical protein [bacterium]
MLKKMFGSGARVKLFRQFLLHPGEEFFIRELTRELDEQINSLRRELENLERIGMLKSSERNRRKYYRVNPHFPVLFELTSIVRKTDKWNEKFLQRISKLGEIDILVLSGSFINQESDVDLFVVGNVNKAELETFFEEMIPDKKVKYSLMTREDFLYRVTLKDKFVINVFADKANLILKNKLKKDTENLVTF